MFDLNAIGNIAWLIPASTFLAFLVIIGIIVTGGSGKRAAQVAVAGILGATAVALPTFFAAIGAAGGHGDEQAGLAEHPFVAG